jgi:hypothetical protein
MIRSLTYAKLAEALGITPESANRLARRKRWPRMKGNDGKTRVAVPDKTLDRPDKPPVSPGDSPPDSPSDSPPDNNPVHAQIARLEGELVGTLEALIEARARADAAEAQSAKLSVDLAAERAKTEKAIADFAALFDRLTALVDEKAKAAKAIAAFAALAERLDALAEERARPWWKRLVGWQSPGPRMAATRSTTASKRGLASR